MIHLRAELLLVGVNIGNTTVQQIKARLDLG